MEREPADIEDLERMLATARTSLQEFEDGADWRRLLLRVRMASPAHPVLLARLLFAFAAGASVVAAVVVLLIPLLSSDLARTLAGFDSVVPYVPEELPALPSLLLALALVMASSWVLATFAAISLGRDTTMLPWEQKQHQKLMNDVTRLTTQKAVMERLKASPQGARPRFATPVPGAARTRQPGGPAGSALSRLGTPAPAPRADEGSSFSGLVDDDRSNRSASLGGLGPTAPRAGLLGTARSAAVAATAPPPAHRAPPAPAAPPDPPAPAAPAVAPPTPPAAAERSRSLLARAKSQPGAGGGSAGAASPAAPAEPLTGGLVAPPSLGYSPPVASALRPGEEADAPGAAGGVRLGQRAAEAPLEAPEDEEEVPTLNHRLGAGDEGILARARAGAAHLRSTPFGAAGRIRPPGAAAPSRGPLRVPTAPPAEPRATIGAPNGAAGSTPRGAAVAQAGAERGAPRVGAAADPSVRSALPEAMFRTPPALARQAVPSLPPLGGAPNGAARAGGTSLPPLVEFEEIEVVVDEVSTEDEDEAEVSVADASVADVEPSAPAPLPSRAPASAPPALPSTGALHRPLPRFGEMEPWLAEAVQKADRLQQSLPIQVHLVYSQEPHLPFTMVIARATPAMAVRAMVSFVEFLAQIATPPRARIELVNVTHLDRAFHKNVEAALEPYFHGNVEVEPNPGQVEILFTEPDPQWGEWPTLPLLDAAP